ncbi:O-antigen ligase family protein [Enterobacteriaceae bacterium C34A]
MEKIRLRFYQLTLLLTLLSICVCLVSTGRQREFFYIAVYSSIIGLALENKNIKLNLFSIAVPIFLAGLLNLLWYFGYEYQTQGIDAYSNYLGSSKKLMLGSILIFYIDQFKYYISSEKFLTYFLWATGIGFILASGYGFWQVFHLSDRVEMGLNRPTITAYIYSVLSLSFIYALYLQKKVIAYAFAAIFILMSYVVILFTGTRAAMGLYFVLTLFMTLYHFRTIHIKSSAVFICIVIAISALSYKTYIKPKIDQTFSEVTRFQSGQDNTSLGARFSMWIVGVQNGLEHPVGQSLESRTRWTQSYVKTHPHLASSMGYMNVHLHNEFIEKYSLQGIPGVVVLLFFFIVLFTQAIRRNNTLLLVTALFLVLYGITDVILLSSEAIIFFLAIFALSMHFSRKELTD